MRRERALSLLREACCNIVRCWGGNVYEDHEFFDFCDRNGIMVWQDFAIACVYHPETEEFKDKLRKEATAVVRKLRNHPALVLWCGDNEVDSCNHYFDPNQNTLTRQVIAKCVEKDPKNRYRSVDKLKKDLKKIAVKNARRKKSAKEVPQEEESN
jgi:beta-mannosidase